MIAVDLPNHVGRSIFLHDHDTINHIEKHTKVLVQEVHFQLPVVMRKQLLIREHEGLARVENVVDTPTQASFRAYNLTQTIQAQQERRCTASLEDELVCVDEHGTFTGKWGGVMVGRYLFVTTDSYLNK
jgi:hypothetical protein